MTPREPQPEPPPSSWTHFELYEAVQEALFALPARFESNLRISGVLATDLFAFNSSLGATIETQVVAALNRVRSVWDPHDRYELYEFVRQPQTFPDVVLRGSSSRLRNDILLGIELKGWYVLAKEREPSFRYKVTPAVCAPADLLVVVPWALADVVSGSPIVFQPFIIPARFAAEYRNWHWQCQGAAGKSDKGITLADATQHYPTKGDEISDRPVKDGGGNFGRFARTGLMDNYMHELFDVPLSGISLSAWQRFLKLFSERSTPQTIERGLAGLARTLESPDGLGKVRGAAVRKKLQELAALLQP